MQIKKRWRINMAVSAVTALIIVLLLFVTLQRVNHAMEESEIAGEILSSSFERSAFRADYLRNNNERAKVQWLAKHDQLGRLLKAAAEKFKDAEDKVIIDKMIKDHESTGKLFMAIVENREKTIADADTALSHETENRLVNQLEMRLYDKVLNARGLREAAGRHLFSTLRSAGWGIIILIAIVAAAATISSWTIGRTIINRIRRLRDGASIIGQGNLDHRIEIKGDDEFADLSKAFNAMTVKLHASYLELKNEIAERKRAEKALRQSEERFRRYFELGLIGMVITSPGKGIIEVNEKICEILGYERSELLQLTWAELTHVDDLPADIAHFNRVLAGEIDGYTIDKRFVRKNGDIIDATISVKCVRTANGSVDFFVALLQDITARKRGEEALRESERRERERAEELAAMIEAVPTPVIIVHDPDSIHMTGNRAADELLRQPHGAEVSLSAPPEVKPRHYRAIKDGRELRLDELPAQRAARGEHVQDFEFSLVFDDGAIRHLLGYGTPLLDEQERPRGAVHVLVDITDRKRAEGALRESEERYRGLFENMIEGFAYCKMIFESGKPQDFIYLSVNRAFETLTGLKNVVGKRVSEVISGIREADQELFEIYGRVSLTGKPERFEMFVEALKMWFSISVYSPEKEFFVAVFDVITERKRADQALRDREQRLRFHIENSPMAVVEWDANFNVTRWAGEAEKMFGWTAAETVGKPIMDLRMIYEEDVPIVNRATERLTSGEERTVVSSNRNYTKSGAVVECVWYNSVLLDDKGQMSSVLSLVEDITERKQAEKEIIQLNRELTRNINELESSNKELEAFIYSVAHDLRAPLRSISGFAEILLERYSNKVDEKGKKHLTWIIHNAEEMNTIIDDLLHLSRISRHEMHKEDVDMSKILKLLVTELHADQPGRRVVVDIKEGMIGFADARLMRVVLSNLLGNAWKFTSKTVDARIECGTLDQEGKTVYYVKDNGAGFDQSFAIRMFLPFHRLHTEQEFEGTGIGLAIVERVIRRHGGKVWAEGKINEGAVFFFTLS